MPVIKRRVGKPLRHHADDEIAALRINVPGRLKMAVQRAAMASRRSLSGEIELLLAERYLSDDAPRAA
jgi:hypothetical protein